MRCRLPLPPFETHQDAKMPTACGAPHEPFLSHDAQLSNGIPDDRPAVKAKPRVETNRVLVTGGAGFVGSHLCDYLVARGDHVSMTFALVR